MGKYIIKRLLQTLVVVLLISVIAFSLIHLIPGDPVIKMFGENITQEQYARYNHDLGLDVPLVKQYFNFMRNFFSGDMGWSYNNSARVSDLVAARIGRTVYLGVCAAVMGVAFGMLFGVISAVKKDSFLDQLLTTLSSALVGTPVFWIAIMLVYLLSIKLDLFDSYGFAYPWEDFTLSVRTTVLPVFVMSLGGLAAYTRQTRSAMLEVIRQDYIRTARSKGLSENTIIFGHALKNAMIPVLTLIATTLRNVIAGSVIVEAVFNIEGIGLLLVNGIKTLDFQLVQSVMMLLCLITCLINLFADIIYCYADPRIRLK